MQSQLEAGGDAEVALPAADRPEEIWLGVLAGLNQLAVGGDDLGREQIVDRQPVLADQKADAAGKGDAADSDRACIAEASDEPTLTGGDRVLGSRDPGLDPGVFESTSMSRAFIAERSMTRPPSLVP